MNPFLVLLALGGGVGYLFYKKTHPASAVAAVPLGASTTQLGQAAQYAAVSAHPTSAPMGTAEVQHDLNLLGADPPLTEDGVPGPKTTTAIKTFQSHANLTVDGIVGPQTAAAIRLAVGGVGSVA